MTPTDATTLVVPLWVAITSFGGLITGLAVLVGWIFATFERKEDAKERHDVLDKRVSIVEETISRMSENVAYIRGILEPKR